MINLFINPYKADNKHRQAELDYCLDSNESNPLIDRIIPFPDRMTYSDFFNETANYPDDINILANTDIYFNETLELIKDIKENECYAITRSELNNGKVVRFEEKHAYNAEAKAKHSQDVWAFKGSVKNVFGNFNLGVPGCDNRIAFEIAKAYRIKNPCYQIQCIHKHSSQERNYNLPKGVTRILPPYKWVDPEGETEQNKHFRTPI